MSSSIGLQSWSLLSRSGESDISPRERTEEDGRYTFYRTMPPPVLPTYKSRVRKRHTKLRPGASILESPWVVFGILFGLIIFFVSTVYLGYKHINLLHKQGTEEGPHVVNNVETWAKSLEETTASRFAAIKDATRHVSMETRQKVIEQGEQAARNIEARGEGDNLVRGDKPKEEW